MCILFIYFLIKCNETWQKRMCIAFIRSQVRLGHSRQSQTKAIKAYAIRYIEVPNISLRLHATGRCSFVLLYVSIESWNSYGTCINFISFIYRLTSFCCESHSYYLYTLILYSFVTPRIYFKTSLIDIKLSSFFLSSFFFAFVFRLQSVLFPSFLISPVEAAVSMSAMKYLRYNVST